ncbi:ShlB/FhaC/HecB family hemolysin secretion/activation protein [Leptolyngbya sp. AN02str]|uniref:ShlB/FhaC/HecB family hemolysin secretion/activation protein n=1 Tax=Leptolyngbya sp. AN02str TaxID=3423363 RepID=UPI003D31FB3F
MNTTLAPLHQAARWLAVLSWAIALTPLHSSSVVAQVPPSAVPPPAPVPPGGPLPRPIVPIVPPPDRPEPILPQEPLPLLPDPAELLAPPPTAPPSSQEPGPIPDTIFVQQFQVNGSTVYSDRQLEQVLCATPGFACDGTEGDRTFRGQNLTFAQLLQARSAITQRYIDDGYISSGAFIPPQTLEAGVVTIQVIEGRLAAINVRGNRHLQSSYVRSRLALAGATPLNVAQLLEGLQLLQLDPLIASISADLQAGPQPGTNVLEVSLQEADPFATRVVLNNGRSPSVGSFRRQVEVNHGNVLGFGDGLSLSYSNTDGSHAVDGSYTVPINPRNGTIRLAAGFSSSDVIKPPFNVLDIESNAQYYEVSLRQPLYQSPTEELAIGLTGSHQRSQTEFVVGGFPSPGADANGVSRVTALRFFQDWTERSSLHVLAARSQFSVGLDLLDSTVNTNEPDSRFFAWRGQGQWVRLLAPETLLLVRAEAQLADSALLSQEQLGLGGQRTVRGYRQDALLADNGLQFSTEVRLPIVRVPQIDGLLQVAPFFDIGTVWSAGNHDGSAAETLAGVGIGLLWQQSDRVTARLDWGIPLTDVSSVGNTLQEDGIYFSIEVSPF